MRLTSRQRRPLVAGIVLTAVVGGLASSNGIGRGIGMALACLAATAFVMACVLYADRDQHRSGE